MKGGFVWVLNPANPFHPTSPGLFGLVSATLYLPFRERCAQQEPIRAADKLMPGAEDELVGKAKRYLKTSFGEDTVAMTVTKNAVIAGTGPLAVDCTVSVGGSHSHWSKVFHFKQGVIVDMDYRRR